MQILKGKEKEYNKWFDSNRDSDAGRACFRFAERWAELMEVGISNGKSVIDIAESTSNEADLEGISVAMYKYAINILLKTWKYGEELEKWSIQRSIGC